MATFLITALFFYIAASTPSGSPLGSHGKHGKFIKQLNAVHGHKAGIEHDRHRINNVVDQNIMIKDLTSEVQALSDITNRLATRTKVARKQMASNAHREMSAADVAAEHVYAFRQPRAQERALASEFASVQAEKVESLSKQASARHQIETTIDEIEYRISQQRDATKSFLEVADAITASEKRKVALLNVGKRRPSGEASHPSSYEVLADGADSLGGLANRKLTLSNIGKSVPRVNNAFGNEYQELPTGRSWKFVGPSMLDGMAADKETSEEYSKIVLEKPMLAQAGANRTEQVIYFSADDAPVLLNKWMLALVEFLLAGLLGVDRCVAGEVTLGVLKGLLFAVTNVTSALGQYLGVFTIQTKCGLMINIILMIIGLAWFFLDYFGIFINMICKATDMTWLAYNVTFEPDTIEPAFDITLALFSSFWFIICCACTIVQINLAPRDQGEREHLAP